MTVRIECSDCEKDVIVGLNETRVVCWVASCGHDVAPEHVVSCVQRLMTKGE